MLLDSGEVGASINKVLDGLKCRFECDSPVVGIYHVPEGCWCWRDPVQALCGQHAITAESTGPILRLFYRTLDIFAESHNVRFGSGIRKAPDHEVRSEAPLVVDTGDRVSDI